MVDSVFMAELSWPEFQAKAAANTPVILPLGATEQHGPHLPLCVDVVLPTELVIRASTDPARATSEPSPSPAALG